MTVLQNVSGLLSCPSGHGRDGTLSRVEVQEHPHGGWEGFCCSYCARARVGVRAWGLKGHLGHSWGASKEGTRLRQGGEFEHSAPSDSLFFCDIVSRVWVYRRFLAAHALPSLLHKCSLALTF